MPRISFTLFPLTTGVEGLQNTRDFVESVKYTFLTKYQIAFSLLSIDKQSHNERDELSPQSFIKNEKFGIKKKNDSILCLFIYLQDQTMSSQCS